MIIVDSREPESIKDYAKKFFDKKVHVEIEELEEGDFKYKNIIIERKRIDDLVSSITDGRLKSQKRKMLKKQKEGYHCYVLIQGEYMDLDEEHKLPKKVVAGAISSLNEYGIHTIHTGLYDYEMMFELIHGLMRKFNEEKIVETVFIEPDCKTWTQKSLMCIGGIGKETSNNIVKKLPHLKHYYSVDEDTLKFALMEVEGVGEKTASNIIEVINND